MTHLQLHKRALTLDTLDTWITLSVSSRAVPRKHVKKRYDGEERPTYRTKKATWGSSAASGKFRETSSPIAAPSILPTVEGSQARSDMRLWEIKSTTKHRATKIILPKGVFFCEMVTTICTSTVSSRRDFST